MQENSDRVFKWRGSLWPIFVGDHFFCFNPSTVTPGSTTFVHGEEFSGLLAPLMNLPLGFAAKTSSGFEGFNEDLKKQAESSRPWALSTYTRP